MDSEDERSEDSRIDIQDWGRQEEEKILKRNFEELLRLSKKDQCHIDLDPDEFFEKANAGLLAKRGRSIRDDECADFLDDIETRKTRRQNQRKFLDVVDRTPPKKPPRKPAQKQTPLRTSTMKARPKSPRKYDYSVDRFELEPTMPPKKPPRRPSRLRSSVQESSNDQSSFFERAKSKSPYSQRSLSKGPRSKSKLYEQLVRPRGASKTILRSPSRDDILTSPERSRFRRIKSQTRFDPHPDDLKHQHKIWKEKRGKSLSVEHSDIPTSPERSRFRRIKSQTRFDPHPDDLKHQHKIWKEKRDKSLSVEHSDTRLKNNVARLREKFEGKPKDKSKSKDNSDDSLSALGACGGFSPELEKDYESFV